MIYERSFFIISFLALSSLVPNSESLATESTRLKTYHLVPKAITQAHTDTSDKEREQLTEYGYPDLIQAANQIKTQNQEISQNKLLQKTEELSQTNEEQPQKFNKRWSLLAILVTSIVFLFLLWILFQKEPQDQDQDQDQDNSTKLLPSQEQDIFNLVDDDSGILDEEEMISSELFPMLSNNNLEELSQNPTKNETSSGFSSNNTQDKKILGENGDDSSGQILSDLADRKVVIPANDSQTDSQTDTVFKLIKDLHQGDRQLRQDAIKELSQTGDFRAIEPLSSYVYQANAQDKSLVIDAIIQIANRSFEPINNTLFNSLEDENSEIRKNAIGDLTALYECISQITKCLVMQMLQDSDQEVQQTAKQALEKFSFLSYPSMSEDYAKNCNEDVTEKKNSPKASIVFRHRSR